MSAFRVVIQPEAEQDLDELYAYLEEQQSGLGFQMLSDLTETIELLEENPLLFQKIYGEMRRAVAKRFGYNLVYKVVDLEVFILAIVHGRKDPQGWQNRK